MFKMLVLLTHIENCNKNNYELNLFQIANPLKFSLKFRAL